MFNPNNGDHHQGFSSTSNYLSMVEDEATRQRQELLALIDSSLLNSMDNLHLSDHPGQLRGLNSSNLADGSLNYGLLNHYQPAENPTYMGIGYNSQKLEHLFQNASILPGPHTASTSNFNFANASPRLPSVPYHNFRYQNMNGSINTTLVNPYSLLQEKDWSQALQDYLLNPSMRQGIINGVAHHCYELMVHPVGSNFITKVFEVCNWSEKGRILTLLTQDQIGYKLVNTACHRQGTRVLQKLIKYAKKHPKIERFPQLLAPRADYLMKHQTARHVVEACFIYLAGYKNVPLYEHLIDGWSSLAEHQQGCIALNACINHMESPYKEKLLHAISQQATSLSQNFYGNHVLQNVLAMKIPSYANVIVAKLESQYVSLCTTKHGSHIVEKCLETIGMPFVVKELLDSGKLLEIAQDPFGNYVVQKVLEHTKQHDASLYGSVRDELCRGLNLLESSPYGRNVASLLKSKKEEQGKRGCSVY